MHTRGLPDRVEPEPSDGPRGRGEETDDDREGRRLAGAVWANKSVDLARSDCEGYVPEDLYAADEVFITSTNRNVIGVGEIAGNPLAGAPGPITRRLDEAFTTYVDDYVSRRLVAASK